MNIRQLMLLATALSTLALGGCGSRVVTDTTSFYKPEFKTEGSIAVVAAEAKQDRSLEFEHYKGRFEKKLAKVGYQVKKNPQQADYLAVVTYGIDNGQTSEVTTPLYGQTGGGTTYNSGTVYSGGHNVSYSNTSYSMPTYGMIGSVSSRSTTYARAIALDIVEAKSFMQGQPMVLLEARSKSSGRCSQIVEVFDEILEAMFSEFPGESGRSKRNSVDSDANC